MKWNVKSVTLALGLLLLVGCGITEAQSEPKNTESTQAAMVEVLHQTSGNGGVDWSVAGNTAYTVTRNGRGALLQAIDLTTGACVPVCQQPGCTHSGAGCSAWVEEKNSLPYVNCLENGNLLLYNLSNKEVGGAAIELRAPDGTRLQPATALPEEGQGWSPNAFYSDGKDLYVVREDRWHQSGWLPLYRLYRIHAQPDECFGSMEEVVFWQLENTSIITGQTTGNGLLVCQLTDDGQLLSELCWNGEVRTIRQAQPQQVFWSAQYSGSLEPEPTVCLYDNVSGRIERLDLATGESVQNAVLEPGLSNVGTPCWLDGTLFVGVHQLGQKEKIFAVDTDGAVKEVSRQISRNGVVRPALPMAVLDGKLLVQLSENMVETTFLDKDGGFTSGQTSESSYGLFTIEQYTANGMDCLPIQGTF